MSDQILRVRLLGGCSTSTYPRQGEQGSWRPSRGTDPVTSIVRRDTSHPSADSAPASQGACPPSLEERPYTLLLYTEDDTAALLQEPRHNDGAYSGRKVLGRQRIPLPEDPTQHITCHQLESGSTLRIAGRQYRVEGCDASTHRFLTSQGITAPPVVSFTTHSVTQEELTGRLPTPPAWPKQFPLRTFVLNGGKVLRYYGEWVGGSARMGGVTTLLAEKVELRVYLEDGTVEVRSHTVLGPDVASSASQRPTRLLRRCLLPKNPRDLSGVGSLGCVERPVLSLVHGVGQSILDRSPQAPAPPQFLGPEDLLLGTCVNINGRLLRLVDCDDFTRRYCKDQLGIDQVSVSYQYLYESLGRSSLTPSRPLDPLKLEEPVRDPHHPLPTSVTMTTSYAKTLRPGEEGVILRFSARLVSDDPLDAPRQFIVSAYVFDSTIAVFELQRINSGRRAGMFFGRGLVPDGRGGFLTPQSLFVGATVTIHAHTFDIVAADEFTCVYMEQCADQFREANYEVSLADARKRLDTAHKLAALSCKLTKLDPQLTGYLDTTDALSVLTQELGGGIEGALSRQQVGALCRRHHTSLPQPLSAMQLAHLAALYIKKTNDSVRELKVGFLVRDVDGEGRLPAHCVRGVMRGGRLPLPPALLSTLVDSWQSSDGSVPYEALVDAIDPTRRPDIHSHLPCSVTEAGFTAAMRACRDVVRYGALLEDMGMQQHLLQPITPADDGDKLN